ncbi:MAG: ribosomal RNA small subunit methyltransferase A [Nitrospirae bacterium]|nr:ribosomal RNA small subunit methyltransferase A [Nitrospirota bacterium]
MHKDGDSGNNLNKKQERPGRPKKHLGQHFLQDPEIISKIIETADIHREDVVVEIGPGRGALTFRMADLASEVIAIEIDSSMIGNLNERAASYPNLTIVEADALQFHYHQIGTRFKVVANLPYYMSTPILFRLIELRDMVDSMTIMLQKEVAERVVASPGSKDYGILSIAVQFYALPEIAFNVSRKMFYPEPKVDSSVLKIVPRERVAVDVRNEGLFWGLIKSAFYYRRKTLLNSLSLSGHSKEIIKNVLNAAEIDQNRRPEDVSMEEWAKIADTLMDFMMSEHKRMKF